MTIRVAGLGLLPPSARREALVAKACRQALSSPARRKSAAPRGEVNVIFLARAAMRKLNRRSLKHDFDTDVIAFNYEPFPGMKAAEQPFGDIYVSAHLARKQAKELGHPVLIEVLTLVIHGALHLIGYDDSTAADKARMFRLQERILAE